MFHKNLCHITIHVQYWYHLMQTHIQEIVTQLHFHYPFIAMWSIQSQSHEAKGYYPLSFRCSMALYMLLSYNSLFLVCRFISMPQHFPSSGTESETPLLSPTQATLGTYADPFALTRRVKVSHHRLISHHSTNEAYSHKHMKLKSLRCSMALYMLFSYNSLFLVCRSICAMHISHYLYICLNQMAA